MVELTKTQMDSLNGMEYMGSNQGAGDGDSLNEADAELDEKQKEELTNL
jgi:hypothetical protein